jgi:hypothetical protein
MVRHMTDLGFRLSRRRRQRTTAWKVRARQRFWTEHGETVRLVLIGAAVVVAVSSVALVAIR